MLKKKIWLIFIIFVSLGFPDGLLGSGWPEIRSTLHLETEMVGVLTMGIFLFSFFSSMMYAELVVRMGLDKILQTSTLFILLGLLSFSGIRTPFGIMISILFLGLGAGCIDVAINDYVSFYYNERVMSWVHACWGIGISFGSGVMSFILSSGIDWSYSYFIIASLEICVLFILTINKLEKKSRHISKPEKQKVKLLKLHYLGPIYYFCYGIEYVVGLYFSTFLVSNFNLSVGNAALQVSLYWIFLMIGRIVTGFFSTHISVKKIIFLHLNISFLGGIILLIQQPKLVFITPILLGYGFSALYPMMMRSPYDFYTDQIASKVISYQVGFQYLGVIILPLVYGCIFKWSSINLFPVSILINILAMMVASKILYRSFEKK